MARGALFVRYATRVARRAFWVAQGDLAARVHSSKLELLHTT